MNKNKGIIATLVAIIILLSVIAGVSIVYNFLGGFYYCRVVEYDKVLGENLVINVNGEGAYFVACNFSGSLVVESAIKQRVDVKINQTREPLYMRAKLGINGIDKNIGYMLDAINWIMAEDGYLYFNQKIDGVESINLCNEVLLNVQMDLRSSTNYILYFVVETSTINWEYETV